MVKYASVSQIDLAALKAAGIRGLLLDADNTVSRWRAPRAEEQAKRFILEAKAQGFLPILVSNSDRERLLPLAEDLDIPFASRCLKPLPFRLFSVCRKLGCRPRECAFIGDQLLTDMLCALLCGAKPVLVEPIDPSSEFKGTRINRRIESVIKRILRI